MSKANFLVSSGRIYSSEYHGILASHLPMALYALSGLGASDQRLTDYYNFYRERLEKRHAPERTIDFTNWTQYLGLHSFHADYLDSAEKGLFPPPIGFSHHSKFSDSRQTSDNS